MKPYQKELTEWAISKIKNDFPDDIALLISVEGHALDSDCHGECFDYFIPATDRGNELSTTFILDGVGHDLYPRSWQRIENMAEFRDDFHNGLADAIILYARSDEDREKFESYRQQLINHFADTPYMYQKALEKLDAAMEIHRTLIFEDKLYKVRMGAGYIAYFLAMAVAYTNGQYFKKRLELPTVELASMTQLPKDFIDLYHQIVEATTIEALKQLSHDIIKTTRQFLEEIKKGMPTNRDAKKPDYDYLKEWYQEMSLTFRRIYIHCDANDYKRVFDDALSAQNELNVIEEDFQLPEIDILSYYAYNDLSRFKERVKTIDQMLLEILSKQGISLNTYATLEDFLTNNMN